MTTALTAATEGALEEAYFLGAAALDQADETGTTATEAFDQIAGQA